MASVRKRPGSAQPWQVRSYDVTGQRHSRQFTRKADATAYAAEAQRAKETGRPDPLTAGARTLAEVGRDHFRAIAPDLAAVTRDGYSRTWNGHVYGSALAAMSVRAITPRDVERWRDGLRAEGVGLHAIRRALVLVGAVLDRAVRDGLRPDNPAAAVRKPSAARSGSVRVVAPEGVERIRAQLDPAGALLVSVLAYAGLRPGEALALTWPDVGRTLRVEHGLNPDGSLKDTKTRARRSVPVVATLAADLKAARPKGAAGPIFPRSDGAHWRTGDLRNWRNRKWKPAVKAAKVDIGRPYDLRHSAASLWLREGVDVATVAQRLGHAPAELLGTYAHVIAELDPTDRRPAADLIAAARA